MKKISNKIVISIILCTFIGCIAIASITLTKSVNAIISESNNGLLYKTREQAQIMNKGYEKSQWVADDVMSLVTSNFDYIKCKNDPKYINVYSNYLYGVIKNLSENKDRGMSIYILFDPSVSPSSKEMSVIGYGDKDCNGNFKKLDRKIPVTKMQKGYFKDWLLLAQKHKNGLWENLIEDDGSVQITFTKPLYCMGKFIGIVGVDRNFNEYKKILSSRKVYNTGCFVALEEDLDYVVDKKHKLGENLATVNNGEYKELADKMKNNKEGIVKCNYEGQKATLAYTTTCNGWKLISVAPQAEILKPTNNAAKHVLIVTLICLILSVLEAKRRGEKIAKPINIITDFLDKTAKLDFSCELKDPSILNSKDETGSICRAVITLRNELKEVVKNLTNSSQNISRYSKGINSNVKNTSNSMDTISSNLEELTAGSKEQNSECSNGKEKLLSLSQKIQEVVLSNDEMKHESENAKKLNNEGKETLKILKNKFYKNDEMMKELTGDIEALTSKSSSVENIINTISNIAEQTNLLALNAAIEAARAGDAGRGFSVVAEEIRKLSEQTQRSTEEIGDIIKEISSEVYKTKYAIDNGQQVSKELSKAMNETQGTFEDIEKTLTDTLDKMGLLSSKINDMDKDKEHVTNLMNSIASIAHESVNSTEEVASFVENETNSMNNILKATQNMENISDELKGLVDKFIV